MCVETHLGGQDMHSYLGTGAQGFHEMWFIDCSPAQVWMKHMQSYFCLNFIPFPIVLFCLVLFLIYTSFLHLKNPKLCWLNHCLGEWWCCQYFWCVCRSYRWQLCIWCCIPEERTTCLCAFYVWGYVSCQQELEWANDSVSCVLCSTDNRSARLTTWSHYNHSKAKEKKVCSGAAVLPDSCGSCHHCWPCA